MPDRFHLAWFCNFSAGEWNHPYAPPTPPWDGKFYVEMAQAMERACFDYISWCPKRIAAPLKQP